MKCKNCGKGRPKLWSAEGGFCNHNCLADWKSKAMKMKRVDYDAMVMWHSLREE